MTSFQSTIGEEGTGGGIADELAESQREISIAEFFEKNKHMLGFDSEARALVTAVKEAVDNALDACEEASIRPDVYVEIREEGDYYRVIVEDNGPGITKEEVPKVFGKLLYGSRFHAREQNRGQQGIGISAAVLYSQLTSGKPAKITSRPKGQSDARYFELVIDTDTNEPEIRHEEITSWDRPHGTRIELEMEANMRARSQLHDYISQTAVVNPHARLELREPGLEQPMKAERATDQLPAETNEIRPHPHGVELGTLLKMLEGTDSYSLSGFLQGEFTRVGGKTADNIIDNFRDRYYGRELGWSPPGVGASEDLETTIADAVANKRADATESFAERVTNQLEASDRTTRSELERVVAQAAEAVQTEFNTTFGSTVRENAIGAAWQALTLFDSDEGLDRLSPDLYALVDSATSTRKDDATVRGIAERLARAMAEIDRTRMTLDELRSLVDTASDDTEEFDDATVGDTARENIVETVWEAMETVPDDPPKVRELAGDRNAAAALLEAMRETDILAPPTDCLAPITAELVEAGLRKEFDADFYAAATRDAEVHGGDPFIVEAGIAYGGSLEADGPVDLQRFANRVPLVYQRGACATTDVVKRINWRNYNLDQPGGSGMPNGPAVITIHVASTNVPFTSESKDALANVPEIEDEIERALREVGRELKSYLNKRQSLRKRREKEDVLGRILPEMATKVADVTGRDEPEIGTALARIMNNVSLEREWNEDTVRLIVTNHSDRQEQLDVTDIVTTEPVGVPDDATVVDLEDEWFVKWKPSVGAGETAALEYEVSDDAAPEFEVNVDGVETAKLTVNA